MKYFDENYTQERPTRSKCLRKKYNLKQPTWTIKKLFSKILPSLLMICFTTASALLYLEI